MSLDSFLLPSSVTVIHEKDSRFASLTVEPLFQGYGTTVGNALRRVMLSSLDGAALTSVKIQNISHEFTAVKGIREDIVEVTLNLKQVRMKVFSEEPVRLTIEKKGQGVITAGDFAKNADVEIVNPDAVIATLTDDTTTFRMDAIASRGRGFVPVEERENEELEVGMIKLDAIYSPVRNVAIHVEPVRIGDITNFDKLVMNIETDGAMSPEEAVKKSVDILMEHFKIISEAPAIQ